MDGKYKTDLRIEQTTELSQKVDPPSTTPSLKACVYDLFKVTGKTVDQGHVKIEDGKIVFASSTLQTMNFDLEIQYTDDKWKKLPMSITIFNPCKTSLVSKNKVE